MTQDNFMFLISLADKYVSIVGLDSNLRASAIHFTTNPVIHFHFIHLNWV